MNKYLTIQRHLFVGVATITIAVSYFIADSVNGLSMLALILAITFFGVPHGSLDTLFAKKAFGLTTIAGWAKFIGIYLSISIIVLIFWMLQPTLIFIIFLGFSALHFSDDLGDIQTKVIGYLYGLNIITLPSILHSSELAMLYSYLIDRSDAIAIVKVMTPIAIFSATLLTLFSIVSLLKNKYILDNQSLLEIASVSLLMLIVRPLFAFTIYFCFMHSARHILRAKFYFNDYSKTTLVFTLILPTLIVLIFCFFIFQTLPTESIDENLIKVTFAALAALTFPHAFLLSKIGFLKWVKSYSAK